MFPCLKITLPPSPLCLGALRFVDILLFCIMAAGTNKFTLNHNKPESWQDIRVLICRDLGGVREGGGLREEKDAPMNTLRGNDENYGPYLQRYKETCTALNNGGG